MRYTDPNGEFVLEACLIAVGVGILIDYGIQVTMNYIAAKNNPHLNMSNKDIWLNNIDWFDVGISGVVSGVTAGYGAAIKAGTSAVGKFGTFVVKNSKYISLGESLLTSTVDITGDGFQKVTFDNWGQRIVVAGVTWGATNYLSDVLKRAPKQKDAYQTASSGGKHSGFLKNMEGRASSELEKGIESMEANILEHQNLIKDPAKYMQLYNKKGDWNLLDWRQQKHLINVKWLGDIQRAKEQIDILRGILKSR